MDGTVRIKTVLSSASLPIVAIDDEYTIKATTTAWETQVETADVDSLVGTTLTAYIPESDRERIAAAFERAFDGQIVETLTFPVKDANGGYHEETYTVASVSANGESPLLCLVNERESSGQQTTAAEPNERTQKRQAKTEPLEEHPQQITQLHEVAIELARCDEKDDVYATMVVAAEDILSLDICLVDAVVDGRLVVKATSSGIPADGYREPTVEDAGMAGTIYQRGESKLYNPQEHPEANPRDEFQQSLAVPIGEYGVFQATAYEPNAFDRTDLERVELLSRHVREALKRIEQEQKLRDRGQELELLRRIFGRVFRHNVRNELNIILSNAEMIDAQTTAETIAENAETIVESTDRLLSHTENAKELDQLMQTGNDTIILSLPSLVSQAVERCCEEYPTADITVDVEDIHVAVHPTIATAIETAIENSLTHNDSPVSITISTSLTEQTVCLHIQDTGTGIPEEERQVINRENETSMTHSTGVGLWLMKWAVEKSDGVLSLENTEEGARVTMTLPQAGD